MRQFHSLPLKDGMALIECLIEQGLLDEHYNVTVLGEEYISSSHEPVTPEVLVAPARERLSARTHLLEMLEEDEEIDTRPLNDLCNTDSIIKLGDEHGAT